MFTQIRQSSSGQMIESTHLLKTIMVIEDDDSIGEMLIDTLTQETSYQAILVTNALQALQMVDMVRPALVITDYRLPQMDGLELYDRLHQMQNEIPAIIMSAYLPEEEVKKRNLISLSKPFELDELLSTIEDVLHDTSSSS